MEKYDPALEKAIAAWQSAITHPVFITWKPEYELGIHIIDEHHRGIVSTINSLYYAMQNRQGESVLTPVINMVNEYTRIHFEVEEDFLRKCGFPDAKAHHALHAELVDSLAKVGKKSLWDHDPRAFMEFLKTWWIDHICVKDRVFRDYLAKFTQNPEK